MYKKKFSSIRRQKTRKIYKFFGGLECGSYNTQKNRRECNDIVRKNFDISKKFINCDIINNKINFKDFSIILDNIIGFGAYGKIYLSHINYKNQKYDIIIKLQNIKFDYTYELVNREFAIINFLSELVRKNITPHFLHYYNELSCRENSNSILPVTRIFIVEKVTGELSKLKNEIQQYFDSIISQIIICIFTFHQYTRHYHCDTRYNNFLFQMFSSSKNTIIKYKFNKKEYSVNVSKYLIILWDYGLSKPIKSYKYSINSYNNGYWCNLIYDYYRILYVLRKYNNKIIDNIIKLLEIYNIKLKEYFSKNKSNINVNIILQIEKELLLEIINNKYIFTYTLYGVKIDYYNAIPYNLDNNNYIFNID